MHMSQYRKLTVIQSGRTTLTNWNERITMHGMRGKELPKSGIKPCIQNGSFSVAIIRPAFSRRDVVFSRSR